MCKTLGAVTVAAASAKLASWAGGGKPKGGGFDGGSGQKLVVFVLGGLSYSELRAVHEVGAATGREVIVGSTSMLTPQSFLTGLKQLKKLDGF